MLRHKAVTEHCGVLWFCCRRRSIRRRFLWRGSAAAAARDEQKPDRRLLLLWWIWRVRGFRRLPVFCTNVHIVRYRSDTADASALCELSFHTPDHSFCVCVCVSFQVSALMVTWGRWAEADSRPSLPARSVAEEGAGAAGWGTSAPCPRPPNMLTAEKSPRKGTDQIRSET